MKPLELDFEDALHVRRAQLATWFSDSALPLWGSAGYDAKIGLFHERLDFEAHPQSLLPRRLMVQCRQLYVFSYATLIGLRDDRHLIEATFGQVVALFRNKGMKGKWAYSVDADGKIKDDKLDSYSLSFLLFTLAWLYRLWPTSYFLDLADEVFDLLEGPLAAPGGGVLDALPPSDMLQHQNPNMHLLEAQLALYTSAGRAQDLDRALRTRELFSRSLLLREFEALPEVHGPNWRPYDVSKAWFEPGHHFEWIWLLRQLADVTEVDVCVDVQMLLRRAIAEGVDSRGFAIDQVFIKNGERNTSRRAWGTCEYLKACAAGHSTFIDGFSRAEFERRAAQALQALNEGFLSTSKAGLWIDRLDADGASLSSNVPASTLYHITLALAECQRSFGRVSVSQGRGRLAPQPALFLDRDGVINLDSGYPTKPADIVWVHNAELAIQAANIAGYRVIIVSNQSAVARKFATEFEILHLHEWMASELNRMGARVDAWYHCPFHEAALHLAYRHDNHVDRKPNPGMLKRAALDLNIDLSRSLLIGDSPSDIEAAKRVGVKGVLFGGGDLRACLDTAMASI